MLPAAAIPVVAQAAIPAANAAKSALSSLGDNVTSFLTLLMTQLRNQDPTSPMDTNQFTSQLVQFSSVEQQINTNSSLQQLIQLTQGGEVLQSAALVGKPVQVTADRIALQAGRGGIQFDTATARPVSIGIYSDTGAMLREAKLDSQPGRNAWAWDGRDSQGAKVPDGAYRIVVTTPAGEKATAVPFTVGGTATGVQKSGNTLQLSLGALKVDLSAVQSVTQ
ncbi:MAG: flagellar hook assembly protein FlgD [Gemmatimonadaceae bacterium]|nr:flagellar hook assembly protein FlgD [Acetobacteraceae bacterium]